MSTPKFRQTRAQPQQHYNINPKSENPNVNRPLCLENPPYHSSIHISTAFLAGATYEKWLPPPPHPRSHLLMDVSLVQHQPRRRLLRLLSSLIRAVNVIQGFEVMGIGRSCAKLAYFMLFSIVVGACVALVANAWVVFCRKVAGEKVFLGK